MINIPHNSTIIIGFSGGPDSVYLLLQLKNFIKTHTIKLIAAHLDHEWRKESEQEANWCINFCKQHNVQLITQKASNIKLDNPYNGSKEEYARKLRRQFLETIAAEQVNAYIALGHHQNDQIETFFIRLARGTSLSGLTGIKEQDGIYIRPLLHMKKDTILEQLNKENITFLQDPSNQDTSFLRNRIRDLLIPMLSKIDDRLPNNIISTMQHLLQIDKYLHKQTLAVIHDLSSRRKQNFLHTHQFLQLDNIIQKRVLLQLLINIKVTFTPSTSLFKEILRFLKSGKNKEHKIHATYKIVKDQNSFSIIKR